MQLRAAMINSEDAMGVKKNPRDKERGNPDVLITTMMQNYSPKRLN